MNQILQRVFKQKFYYKKGKFWALNNFSNQPILQMQTGKYYISTKGEITLQNINSSIFMDMSSYLLTGTSLHGERTQGDERESNIERKGGMRNSPFEKFRQMEQNEDKSKSSDQQRYILMLQNWLQHILNLEELQYDIGHVVLHRNISLPKYKTIDKL